MESSQQPQRIQKNSSTVGAAWRKLTFEQEMYILGLIMLFVGIPLIFLYLSMADSGVFYPCVLYRLTGVYCPGCGGTRAMRELFCGHVFRSAVYHPLVAYTAVIYLVFMVSQTLSLLTGGRIKGIRFRYGFLYGAIAVMALNFILKNVLKFAFGIVLF